MDTRFLDALPTRKLLFPDTLEVLGHLRDKGYIMHLITNGFEKTQLSKLQHSGLTGYFREVITSEGSNSLKPHKEIFEYALQKAGAAREESIMLGDNIEADIQGAMNAGIDQVYVNHLDVEPTVRPTYTVRSLRELKNIF
jgi:putative hydrolase of the HAD superfamily